MQKSNKDKINIELNNIEEMIKTINEQIECSDCKDVLCIFTISSRSNSMDPILQF